MYGRHGDLSVVGRADGCTSTFSGVGPKFTSNVMRKLSIGADLKEGLAGECGSLREMKACICPSGKLLCL